MAQEDKAEARKPQKGINPYAGLEKEMSAKTGLRVKIQEGKVVIAFASEEELTRIINRLR